MPTIKYAPLDYQRQFHFSTKPKVYLSAGYGAGKTYSLCMKMFSLMNVNEGLAGGILCPSLKMFKKDVLPTIREICNENQIQYDFNKSDSVFYFPQTRSTIYVFHAEIPESIRGPNLAFMLMNEVTLINKESFNAAIARVRLKDANLLQIAMSGTPEQFNWAYEYFIENPRHDTDLIFGNTRQNIHLASSYVETLVNSYDSRMIEAYVDGKFVNMTGNRAVWAFDRFKHMDPAIAYNKELPVWASIDFNISPLAATLWNRLPIDKIEQLHAFDEICLESSNTYKLADAIKDKVGLLNITLFPDPAGKAGSTKSHFSDIDILRQSGFIKIKYKSHINSVRDCLNATNKMFEMGRIKIHPKCKNLIADLEQCVIKDQSFEMDKSNPRRTHWLDGVKNMIDYEFPIIRPNILKVNAYA